MHKISNRIFEIFFKKTLDFLLAGSVIELPRIPAYYPNLFRTIAILINNAFKTVQQSAKDKEDICKRADRTAKISDARFHTLMGQIKMHYFRGLL